MVGSVGCQASERCPACVERLVSWNVMTCFLFFRSQISHAPLVSAPARMCGTAGALFQATQLMPSVTGLTRLPGVYTESGLDAPLPTSHMSSWPSAPHEASRLVMDGFQSRPCTAPACLAPVASGAASRPCSLMVAGSQMDTTPLVSPPASKPMPLGPWRPQDSAWNLGGTEGKPLRGAKGGARAKSAPIRGLSGAHEGQGLFTRRRRPPLEQLQRRRSLEREVQRASHGPAPHAPRELTTLWCHEQSRRARPQARPPQPDDGRERQRPTTTTTQQAKPHTNHGSLPPPRTRQR